MAAYAWSKPSRVMEQAVVKRNSHGSDICTDLVVEALSVQQVSLFCVCVCEHERSSVYSNLAVQLIHSC